MNGDKWRLLRDLPGVKAGAEAEEGVLGFVTFGYRAWSPIETEEHPDFFRRIPADPVVECYRWVGRPDPIVSHVRLLGGRVVDAIRGPMWLDRTDEPAAFANGRLGLLDFRFPDREWWLPITPAEFDAAKAAAAKAGEQGVERCALRREGSGLYFYYCGVRHELAWPSTVAAFAGYEYEGGRVYGQAVMWRKGCLYCREPFPSGVPNDGPIRPVAVLFAKEGGR